MGDNNKINTNLIYDLDAINDFIFGDEDVRSSDVEINEEQSLNEKTGKLETISKLIREVKSTDSSKQTVRYDIIRNFMEILDNIEIPPDFDGQEAFIYIRDMMYALGVPELRDNINYRKTVNADGRTEYEFFYQSDGVTYTYSKSAGKQIITDTD